MPEEAAAVVSAKQGKENGEATAVPLACVVCRERHLKCDGGSPSCSRCVEGKQKCFYVQSRRGHRPARKRQRSDESAEKSSDVYNGSSTASSEDYPVQGLFDARIASRVPSQAFSDPNSPSLGREKLRELYYFYFHDAHPIMFPKAFLPRIPANAFPAVLEAVVDYVGAQYSTKARAEPKYLHNLQACLFAEDAKRDAYMVQALTLLGIVYRAQDQNDLALTTFSQATDLALQLGMHRASFAQLTSGGDAIIQEMWRRVWWELYVNELMLAAFRHDIYSRMNAIEMDVELPWEENEYRTCQPVASRSIAEYDQYTFFDEDDASFSSFAYRVIAARSIGRLLALNQPFCPESSDIVTSIDIAINNWLLHLPEQKQTPLGKDGKLDEMMFQAHMMTNAASICLHRPRSDLVFTDVQDSNNCLESRVYGAPASKFSVHTVKCTSAADKIAELITYPGDSLQHTPLFTCMLTLSAVVHISAYVLAHDLNQRAAIRERLALSVGLLKSIKGTWVLAGSVLQSIRGAAREVMAMGKLIERPSSGGANDPYHAGSNGHDPWAVTMHDPLFTQVPELLPIDKVLPLSSIPEASGAIPTNPTFA